jgi:hypothetical protein
MAAPKGNRFWEMRSSHGRKPIFHDADELWDAACEYFEWATNNDIEDEVVFHFQGMITTHKAKKIRPMTIQGLCLYLDISDESWANYAKNNNFFGIVERIKRVIYEQKFAGATVGIFNASIIARELGLMEKPEPPKDDTEITITVIRAAKNES